MDDEILERNRNMNRGFRKLDVWRMATSLYELVYKDIREKRISFKVMDQIEGSALSIASNIAEGYSRRSAKETLRFYEFAISSAAENYSQMYSLLRTGQISTEQFDRYDKEHYHFENKMLKLNKSLANMESNDLSWKVNYQ